MITRATPSKTNPKKTMLASRRKLISTDLLFVEAFMAPTIFTKIPFRPFKKKCADRHDDRSNKALTTNDENM